jgi:peptide/nickel transport system substrate-binding protein
VYIGQAAHATDDAWWAKPIGTGPFVFSDYVANDHVSFTRNDNNWGDKAKLKTLTIKLITDVNGKITALTNNEVQVVGDVPFDQIPTVQNTEGLSFTQSDSLNYWFLWFENSHTPLDNVKVRKAMWQAVDLPTIISSLYGDTAVPMKSFCPAAAFGCLPAKDMPTYNPDEAKRLLAEAGYANGFTVDIIFNTANAGVNNLVQALISAWKAVGITVTPRGEDPSTWLASFNALKWDMDVQPNQTITGDADYTLNRLYSCAAKRLGYCNPGLDQLMAKAQQSTDQAEREKLYQQVVDTMAKDVPAIPLFEVKVNVATRSNVQGLVIPPNEFTDFSTVYLTD